MEHKALRKYRGPETWALVRDAYLSGLPGPLVAERFDVGLANLRKKAREGGWTRRRHALATDLRAGPGAHPPPLPEPDIAAPPAEPPPPDEVVRQTLAQAAQALSAGEPLRANALIKAAEAYGRASGAQARPGAAPEAPDEAPDEDETGPRAEAMGLIWKYAEATVEALITDKNYASAPVDLSRNVYAWRAAHFGPEVAAADFAYAVNGGWAAHYWDADGAVLPPPEPAPLDSHMLAQHRGELWWQVEARGKAAANGPPPPVPD